MHNLSDLILEGVMNSREAGANEIDVVLDEWDGVVSVTVEDDGPMELPSLISPFFTTKGEGRGNGLYMIRLADPSARLEREDGVTRLSFKCIDDGSISERELFRPLAVRMGNERIHLLYTRSGVPERFFSSPSSSNMERTPRQRETGN